MSSICASVSARGCSVGGAQPVQAAVVDDVLARRQPRVQAAGVAQHAHARQRGARLLAPRRCRRPAPRPASGSISAASMRSVVVLPAPLGPSRPVMRPSSAVKSTPCTACTTRAWRAAATAERLGRLLDFDHRPTPAGPDAAADTASGTNAGGRGMLRRAVGIHLQCLSVGVGVDEAEHHVAHAAAAPSRRGRPAAPPRGAPWRPAPAATRCAMAGRRDGVGTARQQQHRRRAGGHAVERRPAHRRAATARRPRGTGRRTSAVVRAGRCPKPGPAAAGPRRRPPRSACPDGHRRRLAAPAGAWQAARPRSGRSRAASLIASGRAEASAGAYSGAAHLAQHIARVTREGLAAAGHAGACTCTSRGRLASRACQSRAQAGWRALQPGSASQAASTASSAAWLSVDEATPATPCRAAPRRRAPRGAPAAETAADSPAPPVCRTSRRPG